MDGSKPVPICPCTSFPLYLKAFLRNIEHQFRLSVLRNLRKNIWKRMLFSWSGEKHRVVFFFGRVGMVYFYDLAEKYTRCLKRMTICNHKTFLSIYIVMVLRVENFDARKDKTVYHNGEWTLRTSSRNFSKSIKIFLKGARCLAISTVMVKIMFWHIVQRL